MCSSDLACEMIGTPAPIARLRGEAADYDRRVTSFVADDADLIGYVARLESMADSGDLDEFDDSDDDFDDDFDDDSVGGELGDDSDDDDSLAAEMSEELDSDELMAEVERFLRDQGPDNT